MGSAEIRSLLEEVAIAADPKSGGLSDYQDLQILLKRVADAAGQLLDERDQLNKRLQRSLDGPRASLAASGRKREQCRRTRRSPANPSDSKPTRAGADKMTTPRHRGAELSLPKEDQSP